ncbi:unnamed protein product [Anisakis simplex]|uniref:Uncharacterized protein n=1 Tax=Anisakis simplex TaxID=6269 RepID=A0A0M3KAH5_ANISI|nr:unnamed protein product [Anisakis simplex]
MVTSAQSEHKNASEAVSDSNDNEMVQSNGEQQHTFVSSSVEQERERREQRKSDEDEENLPIRHVVIDDEDDESSERGVSEPPNETYHTSGLPYGDHNYGEISARSANSSRSTDEGSEHFPVIAGLASYFGDNENEQQQQPPNGLLQRNTAVTSAAAVTADPSPISYRASIRDAYYRNGDQGGGSGNAYSMQSYNSLPSTTSYRITPNPTANFVTIGGRTYVRQMTQNIPQGYRSGPRESYSSGSVSGPSSNATATYTGPRRMSVGGLTQLKRTTVRPR